MAKRELPVGGQRARTGSGRARSVLLRIWLTREQMALLDELVATEESTRTDIVERALAAYTASTQAHRVPDDENHAALAEVSREGSGLTSAVSPSESRTARLNEARRQGRELWASLHLSNLAREVADRVLRGDVDQEAVLDIAGLWVILGSWLKSKGLVPPDGHTQE